MSPELHMNLFWFFAGASAFALYLIVGELFVRGWVRLRR